MFGMAAETPFDIRFQMFGIPVRIHPAFWLSSLMMNWNPERMDLVFVGVLCVCVSVLIHELGHAVVLRYYGWPSEIVLYFLCGYATATRLPTWKNVASVAAGPLAGLAFGTLVYGITVALIVNAPQMLDQYPLLEFALLRLLFSGLIVNLLNIVPVLPLDGGLIMQTLMQHYRGHGRRTTELVLMISIASSGLAAVWCAICLNSPDLMVIPPSLFSGLPEPHNRLLPLLQPDPKFLTIFLGVLCASSVVEYNNFTSWRR
jgi:Zn-dependent protease